MAPWSNGRAYLNFTEARKAGDAIFGTAAHRRLRAVKAAYDPADLFAGNHHIPPAA
jgi:hypothetical protein